jgi:hypothetical protein
MSAALNSFDAAIAEANKSVGNGSGFLAVSGEDRGGVLFASEAPQKIKDQSTGEGVEIAGGLIGEEEFRRVHQSASDGDTLHLSTGELVRKAVAEAVEFDPAQTLVGDGAGSEDASEQKRKLDIFVDSEGVEELKGLKDKADFVAAQNREGSVVEAGSWRAINEDGAAGGKVHGAGEIEEGGFAAAAASHECEEIACGDVE